MSVSAPQEPVAMLVLPADARALFEVAVALEGSRDVDGALVHAVLTWGDETAADERALDGAQASLPSFTHTYARAGLYDVELALTDDTGLVGRARTRLLVAPADAASEDTSAPVLAPLAITLDNVTLSEGARVPAGSVVDVVVHASDLEGHMERAVLSLTPSSVNVADVTLALTGADASATAAFALTAMDDLGDDPTDDVVDDLVDVVVHAVAHDSFGNASAPVTFALTLVPLDHDSDGDGLPDLSDPAPAEWNGLAVDVVALEEIGVDLLGNQRAETVVDFVRAPDGESALASFTTTAVVLDVPATSGSLTGLATVDGDDPALDWSAADVSEMFAVRYHGSLVAPAAATHVIVEIEADDIGVVFLGGTAVASADQEYASDFFRFVRAPVASEPVALPLALDGARRMPLEIIVANGSGPWSWRVRFRFVDDDEVTILNPEAVSQSQFSL